LRAQHEKKERKKEKKKEREREREKKENSLDDIIKRAKTSVSLDKINGVG